MRRSWSRAAALAFLALATGACTTLSVEEERQLASRFEAQARREFRFVDDPVIEQYVARSGQRIVAAAGPQPFDFEFAVVDDPEINAFAGPAGHVYVQTGTILAARN